MASSSKTKEEDKKSAVVAEHVLFAMMDDLGVSRLERLVEDEDRRDRRNEPPRLTGSQARVNDPGAQAFRDAVASGEFQDDDYEGVRNLTNLGDGNLHRGGVIHRAPPPAPAPASLLTTTQAGPHTTARGPKGPPTRGRGSPATTKGGRATSGADRSKRDISPYDPQHPTIYRPSFTGRVTKPVHTSNPQVTSLGAVREPGVPVKRFDPPKKVPANPGGTGAAGAQRTPLGSKTNGASVVQGSPTNAHGSANAHRPVTKDGPVRATTALLPHERAILMAKTPNTQVSHNAVSVKSPKSETTPGFPTQRVIEEKHTPAPGVVEEDASAHPEWPPFHDVKKPASYRTRDPVPVKTFNSFDILGSEAKETQTPQAVEQKLAIQDADGAKSTKSRATTERLTHHGEEKRSVQDAGPDTTGGVKSVKPKAMLDLLTDQPVDEKRSPAHHYASETCSLEETSASIKLIDIDEAKQAATEQNSNMRYLDDLRELGQMESFLAQPPVVQPSVPVRSPTAQFSQPVLELVHGFPAEYYKSITLLAPKFDEFLAESNLSPPRGMTRGDYAARRLVQMHLSTLDGYDSLGFEEKQSATEIVLATVIQQGRRITRTVNGMLAMEDYELPCPIEVKEFNEMVRTGKYGKKKSIDKANTRGSSYASTTTVTITSVQVEKPTGQSAVREFDTVTTTDNTRPAEAGKPVGQIAIRGALDTITTTGGTRPVEDEKLGTEGAASKIDRPFCGWDLL